MDKNVRYYNANCIQVVAKILWDIEEKSVFPDKFVIDEYRVMLNNAFKIRDNTVGKAFMNGICSQINYRCEYLIRRENAKLFPSNAVIRHLNSIIFHVRLLIKNL